MNQNCYQEIYEINICAKANYLFGRICFNAKYVIISQFSLNIYFCFSGSAENSEDKVALESMDVEKKASSVSAKTLKNEHGNYPVWVSKRKIANIKKTGKKNKSTKHVEGKIVKQKGVVRKRRFD